MVYCCFNYIIPSGNRLFSQPWTSIVKKQNMMGKKHEHRDNGDERGESDISICMVGGKPTPLKNMLVSWDDYCQYMEQ